MPFSSAPCSSTTNRSVASHGVVVSPGHSTGAYSRTGMFGTPGCQSSAAAYCGSSSLRVVS